MFLNCKHTFFFMDLGFIFSSDERLRVMQKLLFSHSKDFKIRQLAKEIGVSPALVSKCHNFAIKNNLFEHTPISMHLKALLNVQKIMDSGLLKFIKKNIPGIKTAAVYGSWAKGTNFIDSDLDLWINNESEIPDEKIIEIREFARKKLNTEANILVLTDKKIEELKEKNSVFYCALINSIFLDGGDYF